MINYHPVMDKAIMDTPDDNALNLKNFKISQMAEDPPSALSTDYPWTKCVMGCHCSGEKLVTLLPCLHVLCSEECGANFLSDAESKPLLACKICCSRLTERDIFSGNKIIPKEIFSKKEAELRKDTIELLCDYCIYNRPATAYCPDCPKNLCASCVKIHPTLRISKDHFIGSNLDIPRAKEFNKLRKSRYNCKKHHSKRLEYFCSPCNLKICGDCRPNHRGENHKVFHIEKGKQELTKKVNIAKKLTEKCDLIAEQLIQRQEELVVREWKSVIGSIQQQFKIILAAIIKRRNEIEAETRLSFMKVLLDLKCDIDRFQSCNKSSNLFSQAGNKLLGDVDLADTAKINFLRFAQSKLDWIQDFDKHVDKDWDKITHNDWHFEVNQNTFKLALNHLDELGSVNYQHIPNYQFFMENDENSDEIASTPERRSSAVSEPMSLDFDESPKSKDFSVQVDIQMESAQNSEKISDHEIIDQTSSVAADSHVSPDKPGCSCNKRQTKSKKLGEHEKLQCDSTMPTDDDTEDSIDEEDDEEEANVNSPSMSETINKLISSIVVEEEEKEEKLEDFVTLIDLCSDNSMNGDENESQNSLTHRETSKKLETDTNKTNHNNSCIFLSESSKNVNKLEENTSENDNIIKIDTLNIKESKNIMPNAVNNLENKDGSQTEQQSNDSETFVSSSSTAVSQDNSKVKDFKDNCPRLSDNCSQSLDNLKNNKDDSNKSMQTVIPTTKFVAEDDNSSVKKTDSNKLDDNTLSKESIIATDLNENNSHSSLAEEIPLIIDETTNKSTQNTLEIVKDQDNLPTVINAESTEKVVEKLNPTESDIITETTRTKPKENPTEKDLLINVYDLPEKSSDCNLPPKENPEVFIKPKRKAFRKITRKWDRNLNYVGDRDYSSGEEDCQDNKNDNSDDEILPQNNKLYMASSSNILEKITETISKYAPSPIFPTKREFIRPSILKTKLNGNEQSNLYNYSRNSVIVCHKSTEDNYEQVNINERKVVASKRRVTFNLGPIPKLPRLSNSGVNQDERKMSEIGKRVSESKNVFSQQLFNGNPILPVQPQPPPNNPPVSWKKRLLGSGGWLDSSAT